MIYEYTYTLEIFIMDYFLKAVQIAVVPAVVVYFAGFGVAMVVNMFRCLIDKGVK